MKSKVVMTVLALFASGCSSTMLRGGFGFTYDEKALKQTASFDQKCPEDKINIDEAQDGGSSGTGTFRLTACGKKVTYTRMGMSYFQAGAEPVMRR